MKALGATGELLVVTHSNPKGLKMPLIQGGNAAAAEMKVMEVILRISSGVARREAIDSLPPNQKPKAWQSWFKEFDPGVKLDDGFDTSPGWETAVTGFYNAWFDRQGGPILKLPKPKQDLTDLIALVNEVRKTGFARLEFRACRIGTDKDALKTVAEFFKAKKVVAPKEVRTFFGNLAGGVSLVSDSEFAQRAKSANARKFDNAKVLLIVGESTFQAFATSESEVRTFLKSYISASYSGTIKPFVIGGLEPAGTSLIAGKKHVFPLEGDYLSLLGSHDSSQPAAAGGGVP
jgi:hypothetical protein